MHLVFFLVSCSLLRTYGLASNLVVELVVACKSRF